MLQLILHLAIWSMTIASYNVAEFGANLEEHTTNLEQNSVARSFNLILSAKNRSLSVSICIYSACSASHDRDTMMP